MSQRIIRFVPRTVRPGAFPAITSKPSPTVVILTAVWGRLEVTRVWYQFARRMVMQCEKAGMKARIVVGGDQPEHRLLAQEMRAEWVETPNRPLGAKWNNICESAFKDTNSDYMFVVGSDDVVSPALVNDYIFHMKKGTPYAGLQSCMFFHVYDHTLFNFSQLGVTVGAGRLIHRNVLSTAGFRPWMDEKEKGLDNSMDTKTLKRVVSTTRLGTSSSKFIVDLKSDVNIWSYKRLRSVKPGEQDQPLSIMACLPEWAAIQRLKSEINSQIPSQI